MLNRRIVMTHLLTWTVITAITIALMWANVMSAGA
jgi:hypothetical protein